MTLEAMVKAVNEGKTVINELGSKVFMDLKHKYAPYIFQNLGGTCDMVKGIWQRHDDFEIFEEPKQEQITDRYELMELCRKWDREGKLFLVRYMGDYFRLPAYFSYTDRIESYKWTALDETGHPTGEPQKFMRKVEDD